MRDIHHNGVACFSLCEKPYGSCHCLVHDMIIRFRVSGIIVVQGHLPADTMSDWLYHVGDERL